MKCQGFSIKHLSARVVLDVGGFGFNPLLVLLEMRFTTWWLLCQTPWVMGSAQGLVGPVS